MDEKLAKPMKDSSEPTKLGTKWLWLYTYIRTPCCIGYSIYGLVAVLPGILSIPRILTEEPLIALGLSILTGSIGLYTVLLIGLIRRRAWGHTLNYWVLIIEVLVFPLGGSNEGTLRTI